MANQSSSTSPVEALQFLVAQRFGSRDGEATGGLGYDLRVRRMYAAEQGTVQKDMPESMVDAREVLTTSRKKSEWTGYHAEMMIVGAILADNKLGFNTTASAAQRAEWLKTNGKYLFIGANAAACEQCALFMKTYGINYPVPAALKRSGTAWWNPVTDARFSNADLVKGVSIL